jgi:hypothetical protein
LIHYYSNITFCKDSASRAQYKKSWLFFIAEAPPILSKDSASRFFIAEAPPILLKDSASKKNKRSLPMQTPFMYS